MSDADTMTMRVRLFALLRERAGRDAVELTLPRGATVADALGEAARIETLREPLARMRVVMAVNREYADPSTVLAAGDELALIPPLSGGAPGSHFQARVHTRVCDEPLSRERLRAAVADRGAGAVVTFEGVTREVERLDYESYVEMAATRIERIAQECATAHELRAIAAEHRVGSVPLGEPSVIVAVSAAHREAAFAAAREAIDRIKAEAPIWKREVDGAGGGAWARGRAPALPGSTPDGDAPAERASAYEQPPATLTHLNRDGSARMVDVGAKAPSQRVARARARVRMSPTTAGAVAAGDAPKGDVLGVARIAGIQAAKQTAQLIPLAHPLALDYLDVEAVVRPGDGVVELTAEARTTARTGVEMEAMTACAVAALTVYDMVKGLERGVEVEQVVLLHKRGGRSDSRRRDG